MGVGCFIGGWVVQGQFAWEIVFRATWTDGLGLKNTRLTGRDGRKHRSGSQNAPRRSRELSRSVFRFIGVVV